jgi:hypothetical protein
MISSFIVDLSNPDDIFLKNIQVKLIVAENPDDKNDSYELIAENNSNMFGIITINDSEEGFLFSGDDYLSNAELKIVYRKIIENCDLTSDDADTPPFTVESFNRVMMSPFMIIKNDQLPDSPGEEQ